MMEHFIGQDDFLENNLLSPEDLRFDVHEEEPRSRCSAPLGLSCPNRCSACAPHKFGLELGLGDGLAGEKEIDCDLFTKDDSDSVLCPGTDHDMDMSAEWIDQPRIASKQQRSLQDRLHTPSNPVLRTSHGALATRKAVPTQEPRTHKRTKTLLTKGALAVNDNDTFMSHNEAADFGGVSLRLDPTNAGHGCRDSVNVVRIIGQNSDDGSCSPDRLASSGSDSGLSGGEWAESGEALELPRGPAEASFHADVVQNDSFSCNLNGLCGAGDDEVEDLFGNVSPYGDSGNSTDSPPPTMNNLQQSFTISQQQPIQFGHQILQQMPLIQQPANLLPSNVQQLTQVTYQLPAPLIRNGGTSGMGILSNDQPVFMALGPNGTMIPVMTTATAVPIGQQPEHVKKQPKPEPPSRPRTPVSRLPSGPCSREEALARKRQRMIRNRESALQSRQKRKKETQLLQDEVGSLRNENLVLRDENANLRRKVADLESRLRAATSKGAILCVFGLVVMFNLGVGTPWTTNAPPDLGSHLIEGSASPQQKVLANTLREARKQVSVGSRHLLWVNETSAQRIQGLGFNSSLSQAKPGCGAHWVNSTESLRVQQYLSRWASSAWASASGLPPDSPLTDGLRPAAFIRRSNSFWPGTFSGFDPYPIGALEDGARASPAGAPVVAKDSPLPAPWPSRALLSEVRQRNDTFYLLAFSGPPDTVLLSARQANSTARPKIALLMPAIALANNDTVKIPPGRVAVMQIDCEVVSTKTLYIRRSLLPKNVQMAVGATMQRTSMKKRARTKTANEQQKKP